MTQSLLEKKRKEIFHLKHEAWTKLIYRLPWLLPDRYTFVLTNLCNLDCPFCFQKRDFRSDHMTYQDWLKVVDQLPSYARVTLTGGEPLMFPKFNELLTQVAERFDCNLITNGLLLTEEKIALLLSYKHFRVLSISIDNVGNTLRGFNERQWERVKHLTRIFDAERRKRKSACVLEAKTVVLDENADQLYSIHKTCMEELGCDHHSFQFLKGSPLQHADSMFHLEEILKPAQAKIYKNFSLIAAQLEQVRQYNIETGSAAFLHPKIGRLDSEQGLPDLNLLNHLDHDADRFKTCQFPSSSVHINVDGDLFPCLAVSMGNVKTTPLVEIIQGNDFKTFKDMIRKKGTVPACNRCGWLRPKRQCHSTHSINLPQFKEEEVKAYA